MAHLKHSDFMLRKNPHITLTLSVSEHIIVPPPPFSICYSSELSLIFIYLCKVTVDAARDPQVDHTGVWHLYSI